MLKEEKELRKAVRESDYYNQDPVEINKERYRLITALVRAVRSDEREWCAKVCAEAYRNGEDAVQAIRWREK